MATSPIAPRGSGRFHVLGKTRTAFLIALLVVLAVCMIFSWMTRGSVTNLAFSRSRAGVRSAAGRSAGVDLSPWQTAQALRGMAISSEETAYAQEAERLADHEVDQAFAVALRQAELEQQHRVLTGRALALSARVAQFQRVIVQDKALVQRLKAEASASGTGKNAVKSAMGAADLQVAEAQLDLDSDELTDAQHDLERATGNDSVRIQDELAAHQASMRKYESEQRASGQLAIVALKRNHTLARRLGAWLNQLNRYALIEQARDEAQNDAQRLTAEHNALEAEANAADAAARQNTRATLAQIQDRGTERQILSIDDDRIQTDQQLAAVYGKWGAQVLTQHGIVLHLILQSVEMILLIVICTILVDALVRRLMEHPAVDRRQTQTLRTILQVGVQIIGVLLIVMVIFGPPQQTSTMIGLVTAALTISLQDYILAFFGWFSLAGKSGIRVGDMVEINGVCGEVVEVGLFNTTLLETTGMAEKGEPTGRRVSFLNNFAIRGTCFNFSSEGQWLWDEITISVPASDDIFSIAKNVEQAALEETAESARRAEEEWRHNARGTRLTGLKARPIVMLRPSRPGIDIGSSVDIQLRYVTHAVGRYEVRDRLYRHVIRLLKEKHLLHTPKLALQETNSPAEPARAEAN